MKPVEFLNLANRLHASADEAERRTSIGRSYYASYHVLVESLVAAGVHFEQNRDDHGRLLYYLSRSGDHRTRKIGLEVNALRAMRNDAAYELRISISRDDSRLAYEKANRTISGFKATPNGEFQKVVNILKALPSYKPPYRNS